jgi:hypothetical protein
VRAMDSVLAATAAFDPYLGEERASLADHRRYVLGRRRPQLLRCWLIRGIQLRCAATARCLYLLHAAWHHRESTNPGLADVLCVYRAVLQATLAATHRCPWAHALSRHVLIWTSHVDECRVLLATPQRRPLRDD